MAPNSICTSCLRTLRLYAKKEVPLRPQHAIITSRNRPSPLTAIRTASSAPQPTPLPPDINPTSTTVNKTANKTSPKPPPPPPKQQKPNQPDPVQTFAAQLRQSNTFKSTTEPYIAYGSTEDLYRACAAQCDYTIPARLKEPPEPAPKSIAGEDIGEGTGFWYLSKEKGGLGLDVTFNTWAQVMFLHMYMITVRLRCFPAENVRTWNQNLLDHFFYAAEDRMAMWHGMSARGTRNKYLKELWNQWRGLLLSYDEGLIGGDAVLAGAVWRNVFKGSVEADVDDVALVTAYMRSQLQMLDQLSDEQIAGEPQTIKFADPGSLKAIVGRESKGTREQFDQEELKQVEAK